MFKTKSAFENLFSSFILLHGRIIFRAGLLYALAGKLVTSFGQDSSVPCVFKLCVNVFVEYL